MQHTLVAVFDNRSDAQKAMDDLLASGFSRQEVRLSEGDPTGQTSSVSSTTGSATSSATSTTQDASIGTSIKNFFSDIFGTDRSEHAQMYSEAVTRGHYVLTLNAPDEDEVERAADIVERYGPIDIDEHSQQWSTGLSGTGSEAMRMGTGAQQQSQSMSQQQGMQGGTQYSTSQGTTQDANLQSATQQGSQQYARDDSTAIPVIQEELKVGKREVQRGGVRIYQRVVETPVNETVGLREERVNVERHAVDRPVDPSEIAAFQENTIELRETAEEAVVEKSARVVEEVVVGKEVTQRQEQIQDTVRHTEVQIEQLTPEDDAYFRGHWTSNFANAGGTYEDYAPAYSYGSSMARSDMYRNRPWDEAEPSLRSDWESRYPNSTWEKMKAAVRHGWERMTS